MKLTNIEPNYSATIVRVNHLVELVGLDNLRGFPIYGYQALVSKSTEVGQLMVMFPAESQLSYDFCHNNNLHRHTHLNKDTEEAGYLEDSRRIKAIKMRGHISSALVMPISSLSYLTDVNNLKEGDSFTHIDGVEVCKKYIINIPNDAATKAKMAKQIVFASRVNKKLIPEHIDTSKWWTNEHLIPDDAEVVVTCKLHGTSVRLANQVVKKRYGMFNTLLGKFLPLQNVEYDCVAASRRVIKDLVKPTAFEQLHASLDVIKDNIKKRKFKKAIGNIKTIFNHKKDSFYTEDIYNLCLDRVRQVIPKGFVVYGEIVGWAGNSPIQKSYTYRLPQGEFDFYVYRVTYVNPDGIQIDLTWDQMVTFCTQSGIKYVPFMWRGKKKDFNVDMYMDGKYHKMGFSNCPDLDDKAPCDEGVVIRYDNGLNPLCLKAKSPLFFVHESKALDSGEVDLESQEG